VSDVAPASACCWHGIPDSVPGGGGRIAWEIPFNGNDPVHARYFPVGRAEHLYMPQRCCRCKARRERKWKFREEPDHPGVVGLVEVTDAAGACGPPAPR
jgi:hypothetical protein